jgi:hypothetical protein
MNPDRSTIQSRLTWRWVLILSTLLVALAWFYAHLHHDACLPGPGKERVALDQKDLDLVRRILQRSAPATDPNTAPSDSLRLQTVVQLLSARLARWDQEDRMMHLALMRRLDHEQLLSHLSSARFVVRSFFWLTGWPAILEVVFWTLFGTLCSLLYSIYDIRRRHAMAHDGGPADPELGFDAREMPNHLAKLVFAPFVSVIVIFGYKHLAEEGPGGVIETSTGVVLMSFLLGFYSARAMRMLDRIKEVLLPYDGRQEPASSQDATARTGTLTVTLTLDIETARKHPAHVETLNAELDGARVTLVPSNGGELIALQAIGADNDARFSATVPLGSCTVKAELASIVGIGLAGEAAITISGDMELNLLLAEAEAMG